MFRELKNEDDKKVFTRSKEKWKVTKADHNVYKLWFQFTIRLMRYRLIPSSIVEDWNLKKFMNDEDFQRFWEELSYELFGEKVPAIVRSLKKEADFKWDEEKYLYIQVPIQNTKSVDSILKGTRRILQKSDEMKKFKKNQGFSTAKYPVTKRKIKTEYYAELLRLFDHMIKTYPDSVISSDFLTKNLSVRDIDDFFSDNSILHWKRYKSVKVDEIFSIRTRYRLKNHLIEILNAIPGGCFPK